MIDVHVGRVAAPSRTLKNEGLEPFLVRAKCEWLLAARSIYLTAIKDLVRGPWPHSMSQSLVYFAIQMAEAEARVDELIRIDMRMV